MIKRFEFDKTRESNLKEGIKLTLNEPEVLLLGPAACSLADQISLCDFLVPSAALSGRFFIATS